MKNLLGLFVFNAELFKTPFDAQEEHALYCVDGWIVKGSTPLKKIDAAMGTANKALMYAASQYSVCVINGAHWTPFLPDCDLRHHTLDDLPQLLRGANIKDSIFQAPDYTTLRTNQWHELRDLLPSMFDLWRDNEPEDKPAMYPLIATASRALAGLKVSPAEAVELDEFLQHWNAK